MRLGLAALRGSNPRSSAVTSSFARALRLGGLLVSAFRGLCVAIAAIRPPVYLIATRRRAGPALPGIGAGSPVTSRPAVMSARHCGPGTYPAPDRAGTLDTNLTGTTSRSQETRGADSQPAACPGSPGRQRQTPTSSAAPHLDAVRIGTGRHTASSRIEEPPARQSRLICSNSSTRDLAIPDLHADNNDVKIRSRVGATIRDDTLAHPSGEIATQAGPKFATTKAKPGLIQVITLRPAGSATTSPS